ncbi:uncharacterized protein [Nicotiana sylvestris]|uniref:uncharacterized protein n=1 Tax=Nicotiana sylvestris TaxID=4096 RepID=UPI00388CA2FF
MKVQDYSIIEQLRKTPAQISLLSLLIYSDEHRWALMKILNEAHVPDKITMVKFEWDRQEIGVHGNEIYVLSMIPPYHLLKLKRIRMLKNRFMSGKGMGASLQGIVQPVSLRENLGMFGLGFKPTRDDVKKAWKLKKKAWSLPNPVPRLSKSFIKAGVVKRPVTILPRHVVDFYEELDKRFQSLFDEVNMVETREGSSKVCLDYSSSFYAGFSDMTCMRNLQPSRKSQSNSEIIIEEMECDDEIEYDKEEAFEENNIELSHFEEKPKPNLNETEAINLGDPDNIRETKIGVHLEPQIREEIVKALFEYKDIFAWSYDDMSSLSTDLVVHKFPTDPAFSPVKQKLRKFKTDVSVKIKEEITKQLGAKDGKTRVCIDYRDLNKASPKDNFPLPNIHILIDNYAKHEIGSFVDYYAWYHQILMDEEDAEKTVFITPWGIYCYQEIEVYVDDMIVKAKQQADHVGDLRMFYQRLRRYNLKLNAAKCAFGVPSRKLLGFIVSHRGIELDTSKIKAIQELPPPRNKTELLKKDDAFKWIDECQEAFDKIKGYLSNSSVLVLPKPKRPLIIYLTVLDNSFGYVLGQHDITSRKEKAIYYLSKNFTSYEVKYTPLKRTCCALTWVEQKLKHYLSSYATYLISHLDPLKYIFQKPMPTGRLAKWQILLL